MPSKPHSRYLDDPLFSFLNSTMALLNTTFFNHELAMALNHASVAQTDDASRTAPGR